MHRGKEMPPLLLSGWQVSGSEWPVCIDQPRLCCAARIQREQVTSALASLGWAVLSVKPGQAFAPAFGAHTSACRAPSCEVQYSHLAFPRLRRLGEFGLVWFPPAAPPLPSQCSPSLLPGAATFHLPPTSTSMVHGVLLPQWTPC